MAQTKFIVVTGGVLSGLGKGTTASSIGRLLKSRGLTVTAVKIDPYVNCDAGTMNPFEHGEVFVLEDGGEVDLDLGNYERFLDTNLPQDNNITTGKVYQSVIEKEREGEYLGKTVQIVPHVTDEIREQILDAAAKSGADVCLVEVGGTVGDIESMPFLEGLRQLHRDQGNENVVFLHTTLVPILGPVGEQKTKPTQHSVKELKAAGLEPDMIVCRCEDPLERSTREKISHFCDVDTEAVIGAPDVPSKYQVPILVHEQGVDDWLIERLNLDADEADLGPWRRFLTGITDPDHEVNIAVVGKYTDLTDAYMSIEEAFNHAGSELSTRVTIDWIESEDVTKDELEQLDPDGILVPGGFGSRGTEGKITTIQHARETDTPFLGICYGFQLAIVEFARNVLGLEDATSTELIQEEGIRSENPVIDLLPEQHDIEAKGGTMRLGATPVRIHPDTKAHELYNAELILERHRHRFEVNPRYRDDLIRQGLTFSGEDPTGLRMEICEIDDHPFYMGSQFHPEFKSRPRDPAPLFHGFIAATLKQKDA